MIGFWGDRVMRQLPHFPISPHHYTILMRWRWQDIEARVGIASRMGRKETSSKILVWSVRCPPLTTWQVHRRVAQHSPSRNPTTPHHTPPHHRDTCTPQQARKQAKPSRTRNTRRRKQLHKAVDTKLDAPGRIPQ